MGQIPKPNVFEDKFSLESCHDDEHLLVCALVCMMIAAKGGLGPTNYSFLLFLINLLLPQVSAQVSVTQCCACCAS